MNKTVIILIAVCILSTHAFTHVKRESGAAPAAETDPFKDIGTMIKKQFDALSEVIKPENFQKSVSDGLATVEKTIDDLKKKFEEPKKE